MSIPDSISSPQKDQSIQNGKTNHTFLSIKAHTNQMPIKDGQ